MYAGLRTLPQNYRLFSTLRLMGEFYDEIPDDDKLIEWMKNQNLFHVASAPLKGMQPLLYLVCVVGLYGAGGHVNVSPRGQPSFKLVSRKACWFLDLSGSGDHFSRESLSNGI